MHLTSSIPLGKMQLWTPDTTHVGDDRAVLANRAARSIPVGEQQRLFFQATVAGKYFLQVRPSARSRRSGPSTACGREGAAASGSR